jgi:hypothetical protein
VKHDALTPPNPLARRRRIARRGHSITSSARASRFLVKHDALTPPNPLARKQNYATLVSGVLIGLSEALEHGKPKTKH